MDEILRRAEILGEEIDNAREKIEYIRKRFLMLEKRLLKLERITIGSIPVIMMG